MKKFFLKTFGCQANKSDSERIVGDYLSRGFKETSNWRQADEIIINSCAVRQRAEHRVVGFILNIEKHFTPITRPKIILTGCMLHHGATKIKEIAPQVDEILPINEVGFNSPTIRKDKTHAFVPISTGCNSFCTFCIVPYARGREKSRPFEDVMSEVKSLADQGYREITLVGQNVNSYGLEKAGIGFRKLLMSKDGFTLKDIPSNETQYFKSKGLPPFVKLLQSIGKIETIKAINFLTSNPWDFHDELIKEIKNNKKISRFIHLPLQSGSDRILSLMNRGYTQEDYLKVINKIKKEIPEATFGTDIIVGFPGETDEDFQETVKLAQDVGFQVAFIAQYSPRPGTAAWKIYKDDIPAKIKKERFRILEEIINKPNLSHRPHIP